MVALWELLGIWTAVFFTLAIYSFLYGENPWYRFAEHAYAGVSVGYSVAFNLRYLRDQWVNKWSLDGTLMILYIIALLFGLLWYARFSRSYFFAYRWTLAIVVGTGIGMALKTVIFTALFVAGDSLQTFSNILSAIMTPSVLLYFWFTGGAREAGPMKIVDRIARYTMMAGFGMAYGNTVLTRYSLLIGRSQFLLGILPNPPEAKNAFYLLAAVILLSMIGWDLLKKQSK
jgi:hypothetical protein